MSHHGWEGNDLADARETIDALRADTDLLRTQRNVYRDKANNAEQELRRLGYGEEVIYCFDEITGKPLCTSRVGDLCWDTAKNRRLTFEYIGKAESSLAAANVEIERLRARLLERESRFVDKHAELVSANVEIARQAKLVELAELSATAHRCNAAAATALLVRWHHDYAKRSHLSRDTRAFLRKQPQSTERTLVEQSVLCAARAYADASMPSPGEKLALLDAARTLRGLA